MYRTLLKELLRNAAKARIRRMISDKKRRTDLAAPPMVKEQWEKGTAEKDEMAQLLQDTNWDKELGSNHHPSKSKLSVIHFLFCVDWVTLIALMLPRNFFSSN